MADSSDADAVEQAKARITQIAPREAMLDAGPDVLFLDVREPMEWNLAHLPNAIHIPLGNLAEKVEGLIPRERKVVAYCARGNRSALAADIMQQMGYTKVASMSEGIRGWVDSGGQIES